MTIKRTTVAVVLCLFPAVYLRFWRISSQIVGDDEFHGILAAFDPLIVILTRFQWADNCIPLTAFYRILIKTVGLGDAGLRVLPLLTGLLSVVICAFFLRRLAGPKASVIGMFLAAISPFLIYFSLPALPGLMAPLLWLVSLRLFSHFRSGPAVDPRVPRFPTLFAVGGAIVLGIAIWFLPAASSVNALTQKAGLGMISPAAIPPALNLFSGLENGILSFILLAVCGYGLFRLTLTRPIFAGSLVAMIVFQVLGLTVVRPHALHDPIVLVRYAIVLWPVWIIGVSIGLADLHERLIGVIGPRQSMARLATGGLLPVLLALLFFLGPLPWIYRYPNNFTNHNEFQAGYHRSRLARLENRVDLWPPFYDRLSSNAEVEAVIEYPVVTPWNNNPYHVYQRRHGKRVFAGRDDLTYVVQLVPIMHSDLRLANSVDLTDLEAIRRSRASYLLVHKDLLAELRFLWKDDAQRKAALEAVAGDPEHMGQLWYYRPARESAARILPILMRFFGSPVYEDEWLAAFKIDEGSF